ncbi:MAG: hypothetical protein ACJ8DI_28750 [Ktedonobacteraceae bacterium]
MASPDHHVVGQPAQQDHHLLRFKALFVAFGAAQPLLVALERCFYPAASLIIQRH